MSYDLNGRRILPQNPPTAQDDQMSTFQFAQQQFPQRETQKNYVFVDEHNRHKRLKGCRRRKIKCDAATTNTWPCSACIRLKLHCVRPNGYDGSSDPTGFDAPLNPSDQYHISMHEPAMQVSHKSGQPMYGAIDPYADPASAAYQTMPYDASQTQPHGLSYSAIPPPNVGPDPSYAGQNVFPTPPLQSHHEPSPEAYSPDSYQQQQDLADLLGNLKVDEKGTAPYLRNKASFRREQPVVADDEDFESSMPLPPLGPGGKIRIPPELMPDESDALKYIDAFFNDIHPYVPVLNKAHFFHQWQHDRESISPLVLEAIFAMGGRLRDDPSDGHQWLALASRHADAFMDIPRLSTLQGLLLLLKARESAPKRGYYYRSWMNIVQCVQMGIDLGLEEHYEEHQSGQPCDSDPAECQLRTRIWQTVFVCETMVGAPQDEHEYHISRNFTYFARVVRNVRKMSVVYRNLKRNKEWAIEPEMQQLNQGFDSFLVELPQDLRVTFPPDGSPPWLPSAYMGNMLSYYYLTLILYHRPQLSAVDPVAKPAQWKHHMKLCYDSAKKLCSLQEATINVAGLEGLQCMQRGYSFTVYAGLSCIVLHLVAIVSPDPELNQDAQQFFTRHMRIMEKVMEVWAMPEVRTQVEAVREAFSADMRKPFVLKPSFPYGSPRPSDHSSPPRGPVSYRPTLDSTGSMDQHVDRVNSQNVSYTGHPISPPVSAGASDSKGDSPSGQPIMMMSQGGQVPGLQQTMPLADPPAWNPSRIFEQWNTSFGTPAQTEQMPVPRTRILNLASSPGVTDSANLQDYTDGSNTLQAGPQQVSPQYSAPQIPNFVTPLMWQQSVAQVYEGGLKRSWDYDGNPTMKRR